VGLELLAKYLHSRSWTVVVFLRDNWQSWAWQNKPFWWTKLPTLTEHSDRLQLLLGSFTRGSGRCTAQTKTTFMWTYGSPNICV